MLKCLYETYGLKLISVMGRFHRGLGELGVSGLFAGGLNRKVSNLSWPMLRARRTSSVLLFCWVGFFFLPVTFLQSKRDPNTRL